VTTASSRDAFAAALESLRRSHGAVNPQTAVGDRATRAPFAGPGAVTGAVDGAHATTEARTAKRASNWRVLCPQGVVYAANVASVHSVTASASNRFFAALLATLLAGACSSDPKSAKASTPSADTAKRAGGHKTDDSAAGNVDLGSGKYRANYALGATGSLRGTIKLEAASRSDSTMNTGRTCGSKPAAAPREKAGALVWIPGITSGKPLPMEKRAELSSDDCLVFPLVQAAIVGTTFNVFNDDKTLHRFVFTRAGTHDTLAVMPFFNEGQVVASEKLAKTSGVVEIRCARHPWTRAYIAVFDHPYFDVTDASGKFTIDSIPAGTYTVMVWQDGMDKPESHRVQIAAGGTATLNLSGGAGR